MLYQVNESLSISYYTKMKYNAGSKARADAFDILKKNGCQTIIFKYMEIDKSEIKYGRVREKLRSIYFYKKNYCFMSKQLKELSKNDVLFLQYPLLLDHVDNVKLIRRTKRRAIKIIFLIHDINFLRYEKKKISTVKKVLRRIVGLPNSNEFELLKEADILIVHNDCMKQLLCSWNNIFLEKMVSLGIFDYLIDNFTMNSRYEKDVIIAGNLDETKAGYLSELPENISFGLYGPNFNQKLWKHNVEYYGQFLPNELVKKMAGRYGLVWDGDSANSCVGKIGEYLKYNNPHKTSLYLACGIPVIVWEGAAISRFIIQNNCGVSVSSLSDIENTISAISEMDYDTMRTNASIIGQKLRNGDYLTKALNTSLNIIGGANNV